MKREDLPGNIERFARALAQIEQYLNSMGWQDDDGPGWSGESWYWDGNASMKLGLKDARGSAREIVRALARGVPLPTAIDRRQLEEACMSVRQEDDFDVAAVRQVIDHAALVLTDPKRKNSKLVQNPEERKSVVPPCPAGFGEDTHARLLDALPKADWFCTGDLAHHERVKVSETTVRAWCHALRGKYLEHNGKPGKGSLYRRRPN